MENLKNQLQIKRSIHTLIGASKDLATLTITGVKKTQKMSYTKSPVCIFQKPSAFHISNKLMNIESCIASGTAYVKERHKEA